MKKQTLFHIIILLCVFCGYVSSQAERVGTAFVYQGRLHDEGSAAEGFYDFRFSLFDGEDIKALQIGKVIDANDVEVADGYFTAQLDFGSGIFDGQRRWLEIAVRESIFEKYQTLKPRQELTPSPYAVYAQSCGGDDDWIMSGDDMYSSVLGNIGIGIDTPNAPLHIAGGNWDQVNTEGDFKIGNDVCRLKIGMALGGLGAGSAGIQAHGGRASVILGSNGVDVLTVNSTNGGSVGIGMVEPSSPLTIRTVSGPDIELVNGGYNADIMSESEFRVGTSGTSGLHLMTDNVFRLTVTGGGNVGIGETGPGEKLTVVGKVESTTGGFKFPDGSIQTKAAPTDEISFSVKRDAEYDWPQNSTVYPIDFSSDSTVLYNHGEAFNQSLSRFVTPVTGVYTFSGSVHFYGLTDGDLIYCEIYAGGMYYRGTYKRANGPVASVHGSVTVHMDAGDTVSLRGYVSAASPPAEVYGNTAPYGFTYFTGARVF